MAPTCAGAPSGTPGSQVHAHIQRMKKQLQAVGNGDDIARVAKRTMLTPAPSAHRPPSRSPLTPKTAMSQPRMGSDASPAHSARSGKGATAQDSAQYWHRRCAQMLGFSCDGSLVAKHSLVVTMLTRTRALLYPLFL